MEPNKNLRVDWNPNPNAKGNVTEFTDSRDQLSLKHISKKKKNLVLTRIRDNQIATRKVYAP